MKYQFCSKPWKYNGSVGWTFVSVPKDISKEIRDQMKGEEEGWGRLKTTAIVGNTTWKTAIWFDSKMDTYLLPLKSELRKRESIQLGIELTFTLLL